MKLGLTNNKKITLFIITTMLKNLIIIAIAAIVLSSCAHTIYPVESLYNNYNSQMRSVEELSIKSSVNIYFNEKDIKSEYTVLSSNAYNPFCLLPFKSIFEKKMQKKFLAEAVKQAYEQGGNAILVKSTGLFFVLNLTNWVADDASANFVNPIFNMDKANQVKSGALASMKRSERTRCEKAFMDEIDANIQNLYELEEVEAVRSKIKVLADYNLTLKNPKKSIDKVVKKGMQKCKMKEKSIIRKAQKQAKVATQTK